MEIFAGNRPSYPRRCSWRYCPVETFLAFLRNFVRLSKALVSAENFDESGVARCLHWQITSPWNLAWISFHSPDSRQRVFWRDLTSHLKLNRRTCINKSVCLVESNSQMLSWQIVTFRKHVPGYLNTIEKSLRIENSKNSKNYWRAKTCRNLFFTMQAIFHWNESSK